MNRIVTELFLEKPSFEEASKVAKSLEEVQVKTILLPPENRGINTHLVVEQADIEKVREKLKSLSVAFQEKDVMLIRLENKPGTMAEVAMKVSNSGVNLTYAFSVTMDEAYSFVLLGSDDNEKALSVL
ncbi:hypothetical protein KKE92_00980 [Candidatus Micrarchaeota archaeon]|nr:hypothetical protein [Candidatus Micrarchaeota archaeon]MBU1682183.1 hypothetical protein [Candidatus Micrarchaeota archaeon]